MRVKLSTTINKIPLVVNSTNVALIQDFYEYLKNTGASEKHINNNLKAIMDFANHIDPNTTFFDVQRREQIIKSLDTKIKTIEEDPDARERANAIVRFDPTMESWRVWSTQLKHILTMLTYQCLIKMSDDDKELESAQKDQKKIGKAESNPDTSGPAENLREEAAEMTDESQDSEEPA
jgi:hypothetical protein